MRITTKMWILTGVLLMARTSFGQAERESPNGFYRLDFVTKELDDNKLVNSRTYSMTVSDKAGSGSLRTGSRLPVSSGLGNQFTYFDVGVNIDCHDVRELAGQLTLGVSADISSVATETGTNTTLPPVVRQYKWTSTVIVPLKKSTQIFSSDDLGSKRKFQLELTATPIK